MGYATRRLAVVNGPAALKDLAEELQTPLLLNLTRQILEIRRRQAASALHTVLRLGELLERGYEHLHPRKHAYLRWLRYLRISPDTASRYRHVQQLRNDDAPLFEKWRDLGAGKLSWVARMRPSRRAALLSPFAKSELVRMSDTAFRRLVLPDVPRRRVSAENRGTAVHRRLGSLLNALQEIDARGIRDPRLRALLRTDIKRVGGEVRRLARDIE